jgi:phosphate transport system substrate-binding protein
MSDKYSVRSSHYSNLLLIAFSVLFTIGFIACKLNGKPDNELPIQSHSVITGAGSSFANPIYSKMLSEFCTQTGIPTSYQAIGSSAGIKRLMSKSVDFGASDAFLSNDDMSMFTSSVVEFPTCLGAVVITYNLSGDSTLRLTSDILADIYLGKITKWNDPRIKEENKGLQLPDLAITVVHRADGSGTSYVFTDYLSKVNSEWRTKVGMAKLPNWPVGIEGDGNEGVASRVKSTPGAIGYVELVYALQKNITFALLKNASGKYIKASLESTSLAANVDIPADTRISITNSSVADAYPISSFTWVMLYKEQSYNDRSKLEAIDLVKELSWMITEGQQYTKALNYAPLPPKAIAAAKNVLASVTFAGTPVLKQE